MAEYRLLIVDDEPMTRYGLVNLFDWNAMNIEVVGEADDGTTALPLLEKLRPDIVLSDVKMAHMNGIEFAKQAKEKYPDLRIIFLSGYNEADYMRSALKLGAVDYILKPVDYEELKQCLHRVMEGIRSDRLTQATLQRMKERINEELPALREHFVAALIKGQVPTGKRMHDQLEKLKLKNDRQLSTAAIVLTVDEQRKDASEKLWGGLSVLKVALKNISDEIMAEYFQSVVIEDPFSQNRMVLVVFLKKEEADSGRMLEMVVRLQKLIETYLKVGTSFGLGKVTDSVLNLKDSYNSANEALKHRSYLGGECIIPYDFSPPLEEPSGKKDTLSGRLREFLMGDDREKLVSYVDDLFSRLARLHFTDITFYRNKISHYVFESYSVLCEQLGEDEELSPKEILDQLFHSETLDQMRILMEQYCVGIQELIRIKNDAGTVRTIQQVQKTIKERYNENLTISELAADVYLTPTYLCVLFRQITGTTINHYQTMVRMEKAKELLMDLSNKLYDVSYAVGYVNPSYFSRQFKKYVGYLPSEYRDRMLESGALREPNGMNSEK